MIRSAVSFFLMAFVASGVGACSPTVRLEAPSEPIQINMNIKIEQEVRVRVERDLEDAFAANPALFGVPSGAQPSSGKGNKK